MTTGVMRGAVGVLAIVMAFGVGLAVGLIVRQVATGTEHDVPPAAPPAARSEPPFALPPEDVGRLALIVLAGQSNMSGYGPLDDDVRSDPRVYVFANDYRWDLAREPVDHDVGQVDQVSRDQARVGPGLAFALALLALQPELRIGLVPCARGGSSIAQWQRNMSDQSLYGSCLKRLRAASPMGRLAGILFFQGEADALREDPVRMPAGQEYAAPFERFVADFRADAGDPGIPFVFAQLGAQPAPDTFVHWAAIKAIQQETTFPCAAMIVTDDLPTYDGLHFTTPAYRIIGARFADAFDSLTRGADAC